MKATVTTLVLAMLALAFSDCAESATKAAAGVGIQGYTYIHDPKLFKSEESKTSTAGERRAVVLAKEVIAKRLKAQIRGRFSVASAGWGYQVNFSRLEIKKLRTWKEVSEGFGEVFFDKNLDKVEINYGP